MGTVVLLLSIIFFKEKPPTPPSAAESEDTDKVCVNVGRIFKDKNAMILVLCFGFIFGTVNTYGTVIGILTAPLGFTDSDSSYFGAVFIIGGIIGSGVMGGFVEATKKYKTALWIISFVSILAPFLLMYCLTTGKVWVVCISALILGTELAVLPVGIDFGVELTFPITEAISTGLLMTAA